MVFLALDWSKAFDSVDPERLCHALIRFGIPQKFCDAAGAVYKDRQLTVRDSGHISSIHRQHFSISQGGPLSPFFFSILMTVLLFDTSAEMHCVPRSSSDIAVDELVYADDPMVVAVDASRAETYMSCIASAGMDYGLCFNWCKVEALPIRCNFRVLKPDGCPIECKSSMIYLGSLLDGSGDIGSELNRRLGSARAAFKTLTQVWKHARISRQHKLRIFEACIGSQLLYCLHTAWLNKAALRKLDGFQGRCLRKILGVPHAYVSRISNLEVLGLAACKAYSKILLYRQLQLIHQIALLPSTDVMRTCVFEEGSFSLKGHHKPRCRGRPKQVWASQVYQLAVQAAGSVEGLANLWSSPPIAWRHRIRAFCFGD